MSAPDKNGWRPNIETAPRDEAVLVYGSIDMPRALDDIAGPFVWFAHWDSEPERWVTSWRGLEVPLRVTHWQPLPKPPEAA